MVFDKTGTLTDEGLSVSGFKVSCEGKFENFHHEVGQIGESKELFEEKGNKLRYVQCLASCHTASKLDDMMIGDPLDIKMFEATKWVLDESRQNDKSTTEEA